MPTPPRTRRDWILATLLLAVGVAVIPLLIVAMRSRVAAAERACVDPVIVLVDRIASDDPIARRVNPSPGQSNLTGDWILDRMVAEDANVIVVFRRDTMPRSPLLHRWDDDIDFTMTARSQDADAIAAGPPKIVTAAWNATPWARDAAAPTVRGSQAAPGFRRWTGFGQGPRNGGIEFGWLFVLGAVGAIVAASIFFAIARAWRAVRARRRWVRGQCPGCGYPLSGDRGGACSECGARRTSAPSSG
ncbi:MAG: hypothetical protein AB8G96_03735 [Phycisphaerales bacterium]